MQDAKIVLAKFKKAKKNKTDDSFFSNLEEAYKYCCPRRYNKDVHAESEIFDSTAVFAVQSRVAANHDSLFPAFREWIGEEAVSRFDDSEKLFVERQIKKRINAAHKAIELSNFHIEIEDTLTDTMFSDGAILVFAGEPENPLRFQAVDWFNFYTLNDMNGEPSNNFLLRKLTLENIRYFWPKAKLDHFDSENKDKELECMDCYTYDEQSKKYTYSVFIGDERIFASEEKSSPWVVFNQKRRAKSNIGWGAVLDSMADIRTTNKIEEYLLRHAAFNVAGIWQADDDGVLNVDNIKLVPGCIIPKAPGSAGLQPLHTQANLNLTQFVLSEQKENIKKSVQGSALPAFSDGVRTAQEYQMRDAELKKTEIPIMLQLAQGSKRLMRRIFDILESPRMKTSEMYCQPVTDNKGKKIQTAFSSPLIRLKDQIEMKSNLQVMATAAQIFGQAAYDVVNQDKFLRDFYIKNNFTPEHIREENEIEKYREDNKQQNIELAQAGVKQTKPTPGNIRIPENI